MSWAKDRKHELVASDSRDIDFVFISEGTDFLRASNSCGAPKVFDLIDGYLGTNSFPNDLLRGSIKSFLRQHRTYPRPYSSIVAETCEKVDLVICSSEEQKTTIYPYNQNVHVILDNHSEFPFLKFNAYSQERKKVLFWEGTTFTLEGIERLLSTATLQDFQVNLVTDVKHPRLTGRFLNQSVVKRLAKNLPDTSYELTPWSLSNVIEKAKLSSTAILPVDTRDQLQVLKPENRLLIMFRLALPCFASNIPSYARVENNIGCRITCKSLQEWEYFVNKSVLDSAWAENQVNLGQRYLKENHSEEIIFDKWDKAIQTIL